MIFINDYTNKVEEINNYFEFVFAIDKSKNINLESIVFQNNIILEQSGLSHLKQLTNYSIDNQLKGTLKANAYLLLYNLIEGSVTAGIDGIFLAINQSEIELKYLKKEIRELYLDYSMKRNDDDEQQKTKSKDKKDLRKQFNGLIDTKVKFKHRNKNNVVEGYQAYLEKMGGEISGNIDASKLEELSIKYGFSLPTITISDELLIIKNKRNQLAHGEITFSEAGKDKSIEEMIVIKNAVTQYFNSLMNNIKYYIENEEFKM